MGSLFKSYGGSKITWGFGKAVGCAAFWWGIGGRMEIVMGFFHGVCWRGQLVQCNSMGLISFISVQNCF